MTAMSEEGQDLQEDCRAEDRKAYSEVFDWAAESE